MRSSRPVELGRTKRGKTIALTDAERATHVHVIGTTGTGKSRLLEHMIKQDIVRGRGLCLIDPQGTLYERLERWCATRGVKNVHLVKPGADGWITGFNPVRPVGGQALEVRVNWMVSACSQVWGGQDLNQTPRLKRVLRAVFYALAVRDLTLTEAIHFLRAKDPQRIREELTSSLGQPVYDFIWGELNDLQPRQFAEYAESTISRLTEFLTSPAIHLMLGQQETALDFRRIMDNGEVVLVNLGSRETFSPAEARVLGTLLVNDMFLTALGRTEKLGKERPFSLYIDEAHKYLTTDVAEVLDGTRKFGLHAVFAHQRLNQLRRCGEDVYDAVMGCARTKVVFALQNDEDAAEMAKQVLRSTINLQEPKRILDKPTVVDEVPYIFRAGARAETTTEGRTTTETSNWTLARGTSAAGNETYSVDPSGRTELTSIGTLLSELETLTEGGGSAVSDSYSKSVAETDAWNEGRVAVRKVLPTATYSLEEQLHRATLKLRQLKQRQAIIQPAERPPVGFEVAEVRDPLDSPALLNRFRDKVSKASPYICTVAEAHEVIEARSVRLLPGPAASETDFWNE